MSACYIGASSLGAAVPGSRSMPTSSQDLIDRLRSRGARLGVIGLGYVGLPLAVEFANAGFSTVGFDLDEQKVRRIMSGDPCGLGVAPAEVEAATASGRLVATTDFGRLKELDSVNICVPTPLRKTKAPDLSHVVSAVEQIAKHLNPGQLVILESTTYPGTVDEVVRPMLEATGLQGGDDFFLAFSPERVDPGNTEWTTGNIPKVVGGIDATSTAVAQVLYEQVVGTVVPVSSTQAAEMVKLLENTFRAVNIGLANEFALICHRLDVDVWEVIEAASTKPFGFMPFYPGPGLGGHCIPIDPFYLSWRARQAGFESRFIDLAGDINAGMPRFVVELIVAALNVRGKPLRRARIHLFGISYKPGVSDVRESPAIDIGQLLQQGGAVVSYSDPHVPTVSKGDLVLEEVPCERALKQGFDCGVITTAHSEFDYEAIANGAECLIDTRNALKGFQGDHIQRL